MRDLNIIECDQVNGARIDNDYLPGVVATGGVIGYGLGLWAASASAAAAGAEVGMLPFLGYVFGGITLGAIGLPVILFAVGNLAAYTYNAGFGK